MFHASRLRRSPQTPVTNPADTGLRDIATEPTHLFFLRIFRLMAIGGVNDARAVSMLMGQYGRNHRRPLMLIRAMMLELSRVSNRQIKLAPPCCNRMTRDEALILMALARPEAEFAACHADACMLLDRENALGAATCFRAVANCLSDMGTPLS